MKNSWEAIRDIFLARIVIPAFILGGISSYFFQPWIILIVVSIMTMLAWYTIRSKEVNFLTITDQQADIVVFCIVYIFSSLTILFSIIYFFGFGSLEHPLFR